jgi:hypothetical protein
MSMIVSILWEQIWHESVYDRINRWVLSFSSMMVYVESFYKDFVRMSVFFMLCQPMHKKKFVST